MKNTFIELKGGKKKMDNSEKPKGNKPDLVGTVNVAAWLNTDKEGNKFLAVKIANRADLYVNENKNSNTSIEDIFE
jgi:hypothetical protein